MAAGVYKSGVAIIVTYQAVAIATGKSITMSVYDAAHALDAGQSGAMAEVVATGRYWKAFTPDTEGEWIIVMVNTTDGGGDVVKAFAVAGHDVDSIGDAIATIDGEISTIDSEIGTIDTEVGDIATAVGVIDGEIETIDTEVGDIATAVSVIDGEIATIDTEVGNNTSALTIIDAFHDVPGEDVADDAVMSDVVGKKSDTVAGTSMIALAKQLLADTGTTGSIRGADDDTLKSLSDQIDSVSSPAMVG